MTYYYKYKTKIGDIYFLANDEYLLALSFKKFSDAKLFESEIIKAAYKQVSEYLDNKRKVFNLPLLIEGSDFNIAVLNSLYNSMYGSVLSYKDLAILANSPKAYRAVGSVCNKNPYPIIIPCHRIVKNDGRLGNYAYDIQIKIDLLEIEGMIINGDRVITNNYQ